MKLDTDTGIQQVAATSLGVEGWALADVGQTENSVDDSRLPASSDIGSESVPHAPEKEAWTEVTTRKRGGIAKSVLGVTSDLKNSPKDDVCRCAGPSNEYFCASKMCQNNQHRKASDKSTLPAKNKAQIGSATTGRVCTDEGSPRSAISRPSNETPPRPKPGSTRPEKLIGDLLSNLENVLKKADGSSNAAILASIQQAVDAIAKWEKNNYWLTDAGQAELLRKIDDRSRAPCAGGLCVFDYTQESKAMLSSVGPGGQQE